MKRSHAAQFKQCLCRVREWRADGSKLAAATGSAAVGAQLGTWPDRKVGRLGNPSPLLDGSRLRLRHAINPMAGRAAPQACHGGSDTCGTRRELCSFWEPWQLQAPLAGRPGMRAAEAPAELERIARAWAEAPATRAVRAARAGRRKRDTRERSPGARAPWRAIRELAAAADLRRRETPERRTLVLLEHPGVQVPVVAPQGTPGRPLVARQAKPARAVRRGTPVAAQRARAARLGLRARVARPAQRAADLAVSSCTSRRSCATCTPVRSI